MIIRSLRLFNFRNLLDQELEFSAGINLLHGRNAQGKTNFVEAIQLLSSGRSFRTSSTKDCIRFGQTGCSVFGKVHRERSGADYELGVALERTGRASYFLNGETTSLVKNFLGRLVSITFSPADLAIVQGTPALRRKFVDRHMSDLSPTIFDSLMKYQKALRSKQILLKKRSLGPELDAWNQVFAEYAAKVTVGRIEFLSKLQQTISPITSLVAPQDGEVHLALQHKGSEEALVTTEQWRDAISRVASKEVAYEGVLIGPHLDDIQLSINGFDAREYASQGQARSLILCAKLAVIELLEQSLGESPVVVLDDVNSELDAIRAVNVFSVFLKPGRQIFATSTEAESGPWAGAHKFEVQQGRIFVP